MQFYTMMENTLKNESTFLLKTLMKKKKFSVEKTEKLVLKNLHIFSENLKQILLKTVDDIVVEKLSAEFVQSLIRSKGGRSKLEGIEEAENEEISDHGLQ